MSRTSTNSYIDGQLPDNNQQLIKPVNARNVTKRLLTESFNLADDDSDDINEGSSNLFFTDERSHDATAALIQDSADSRLTWDYDDTSNTLTPTLDLSGLGDQNIGDVLTNGNDAGAQQIKNILDATDPQDVPSLSQVETLIATTSVPDATPTVKGKAKLFTSIGSGTDGAMDQNSVTNALAGKQDSLGYTAENSANKATTMSGNTTSNIVYLTAKAVYDWATGLFLQLSGGSLTGALNEAQGTDIASASTTNIAGATGNYVRITGTTTITALGTAQAGTRRIVTFAAALTLTHNATSLILPTSANITTAAGDSATFVSLGSGNWRCVSYTRQDGSALVGSASAASETVAGIAELATQTETNTGTDDARIVTPLKLATWWTNIKTLAQTITALWTFNNSVRFGASSKIQDANGNAVLEFVATTSAVNNVQIRNAAASGTTRISAVGTDSNIPIRLDSKGTGTSGLQVNGSDKLTIDTSGVLNVSGQAGTGVRVVSADSTGNQAASLTTEAVAKLVQTSDITVSNTTTETVITNSSIGALSITSASNVVGKMFSFLCNFQLSTAGSSAGNIRFRLRFGPSATALTSRTVLLDTSNMALVTGLASSAGTIRGEITEKTVSSTATVEAFAMILIDAMGQYIKQGANTIDLTVDNDLSLTVQFDTASASNVFVSKMANILNLT